MADRNKIADELMNGCPDDTLAIHSEIARALRSGESRAKILDMCDDVPETYSWLYHQLSDEQ